MKKIWFFVEGDAEEYFVRNLIRNKYSDKIKEFKNQYDFVNLDFSDGYACYIENCGSVEKIPHKINEIDYRIKKSGADNIIIICDIEKLGCFSNRKNEILRILKDEINIQVSYIFCKPMVENHYWDCEDIIKRIIALEYKNKYKKDLNSIIIPNDILRNQFGLKSIFNSYKIKYRESSFAEGFFSRVDYQTCGNITLKRTINILENIIE